MATYNQDTSSNQYVSSTVSKPTSGSCTVTNLASDPRGTALLTNSQVVGIAAFTTLNWFGSGGTGSNQVITGASYGPIAGLNSYIRKAWTTDTTSNTTTGIRHSLSTASGFPIMAGYTITVSAYVRASLAVTMQMRLEPVDSSSSGLVGKSGPALVLSPGDY
jgi:hypothetical protein